MVSSILSRLAALRTCIIKILSPVIRVTFSKKDHERDMKRTFSKTIVVTNNELVISTLTQDSSEIQASVISPSKSRVAILRKTESNGEKKRFVEIWCDDRLEVSRNVTTSHGAFYTEGTILTSDLQLFR